MTDTPKLWRDMTDAEKGALLLAAHRGEAIRIKRLGQDWSDCENEALWMGLAAYRVKPAAPKVVTVVRKYCFADNGRVFPHHSSDEPISNITHTYTITDGRVTACDTIIHD